MRRKRTVSPEEMDPHYARWKRKHPKFPGVARCVELLRRHNTQGGTVDAICGDLLANATAHARALIEAFRSEPDERVRRILLGIIVQARLPETLDVFIECLKSPDESLRFWAVEGLRDLGTKDARKALWEAGLARR